MQFNIESLVQSAAPGFLGIALITITVWMIKRHLKSTGQTFGEWIQDFSDRDNFTVALLAFLALVCFSEGLFAAGIEPDGEQHVNYFSRLVGHVVLAMVAVLIAIFFPKQIIETIGDIATMISTKDFKNVTLYMKIVDGLIAIFVLAVATIFLPFGNLWIIGFGLNCETQMWWVVQEWLLQRDMYNTYAAHISYAAGDPWNVYNNGVLDEQALDEAVYRYSPTRDPIYPMAYMAVASLGFYFAHLLIAIVDGLVTAQQSLAKQLNQTKRATAKKAVAKNSAKASAGIPEDEIMKNNGKKGISFILKAIGKPFKDMDEDEFKDEVAEYQDIFGDLDSDRDRAALTTSMASIISSFKKIDKAKAEGEYDDIRDVYDKKRKQIIANAGSMFAASTKGGKGFGRPLRSK